MEEKKFMEMYEKMFLNFQEQVRIYMVMVVEKTNGKEGTSLEILDFYKKNLNNTLNVLASIIDNVKDEGFKNFYKPKIEYNYQYIEELSSVLSSSSTIKK